MNRNPTASRHRIGAVTILSVVGVLLLVMVSYLALIPLWNMRPDEALTYAFINRETFVQTATMQFDTIAPAWHIVFWVWVRQLFGDGEAMGRAFALLLVAPTLALVYRLAADNFGQPRYGRWAMLWVATSIFFLQYALEIRFYLVVMAEATLSTLVLLHWLRRRGWRSAALYGVSTAVMMYTHYYLVFLIAVQVLFALVIMICEAIAHRDVPERKRTASAGLWRMLQQLMLAGGVGLALWLPWLPRLLDQFAQLNAAGGEGVVQPTTPTPPTSWATLLQLIDLNSNNLPLLALLLLLVGSALHWRRRAWWMLLLWAVVPPTLVLLINLRQPFYVDRYVIFAVVGSAMALGIAAASLPLRGRWREIAAAVLFIIWAAQLPAAVPRRAPMRDILRQVSELSEPGDIVFADITAYEEYMQYHFTHYLDPDLLYTMTFALPAPQQITTGVWHITNRFFDATTQQNFDVLEADMPLQHVLGECSNEAGYCFIAQRLETAPSATPLLYGDMLKFYGADVESHGDDSITMQLWWRVAQPVSGDWVVSVQLIDSDGQLVSQPDGAVNDQYRGEVTLDQMQPDTWYLDLRSLDTGALVDRAATVVLVVYDYRTGERIADEQGRSLVTIATIPAP